MIPGSRREAMRQSSIVDHRSLTLTVAADSLPASDSYYLAIGAATARERCANW